MIQYYVDIMNDAAAAGLLVNFHGATLPRGWQRTWPNLMSAEAVRGFEYTTFEQKDEDVVAAHAVMQPFTRNLFDPMDFTPMVFGDIPKIKRVTRNGFELAESVLFLSGIQHFAEIPEGMATAPAYVKTFLRELPRSWDEVKFVAGYPGRQAVIARKSGNSLVCGRLQRRGQGRRARPRPGLPRRPRRTADPGRRRRTRIRPGRSRAASRKHDQGARRLRRRIRINHS
jgi:alpha-glucosidase